MKLLLPIFLAIFVLFTNSSLLNAGRDYLLLDEINNLSYTNIKEENTKLLQFIPKAKRKPIPRNIEKEFRNLISSNTNYEYHNYITVGDITIYNLLPEIRVLPKIEAEEVVCLALNMYHEARNSSISDKLAVSFVVTNRVKHQNFPNSICEVVWQFSVLKNKKKIAQFSWTKDGKSDIPKSKLVWRKIQKLAYIFYYKNIPDITNGRLNYYAHKIVSPIWSKEVTNKIIIGQHTYLTAKEHKFN